MRLTLLILALFVGYFAPDITDLRYFMGLFLLVFAGLFYLVAIRASGEIR